MRTILFVHLPHEPFNTAVRNGTAAATMKKILDDLKPEAAYFTEINGHRSGVIVVDIKSASDIPKVAEPWFLSFNADVQLHPAMTVEDLVHADLTALGKKW